MKTLKTKIIIHIVLSIVITLLSCTVVNGYSARMKLTARNGEKLESGRIYAVTASFEDLDVGPGIDSIIGRIKYDKNILEVPKYNPEYDEEEEKDNPEGKNGWIVQDYDSEEDSIILTRNKLMNKPGNIFEMYFVAKAGITTEYTEVEMYFDPETNDSIGSTEVRRYSIRGCRRC